MEDKKFYEALGAVLREEREKRNLKQEDVGAKLGVSKMTVSYYESGNRTMTALKLSQYCKVLGITIQSVFDKMK